MLPSLQQLFLICGQHEDDVNAFLEQTCGSLTSLRMANETSGRGPGVVFAELEELHMIDFTFADKCPAIKRITVSQHESSSLFQLPYLLFT